MASVYRRVDFKLHRVCTDLLCIAEEAQDPEDREKVLAITQKMESLRYEAITLFIKDRYAKRAKIYADRGQYLPHLDLVNRKPKAIEEPE